MTAVKATDNYEDFVDSQVKRAEGKSKEILEGSYGKDRAPAGNATSVYRDKDKARVPFDRADVEDEFQKAEEGNTLDHATLASLKSQNDMLASSEKAATLAFRTPVQLMVYGVNRDYGQVKGLGYISHVLRRMPLMKREQGA